MFEVERKVHLLISVSAKGTVLVLLHYLGFVPYCNLGINEMYSGEETKITDMPYRHIPKTYQ